MLRNVFGYLFLLLGSLILAPALAYETLIGEYTGKIVGAAGYDINVGNPCSVVVEKSGMYGGSLIFEIRGAERILIETWNVEKALEQDSRTVKMATPGGPGRPTEAVVFFRNSDGAMQNLKLMFKGGRRGHDRSVNCGDLLKT